MSIERWPVLAGETNDLAENRSRMIRKIALSLGIAEEELLAQAHGRSKTGDALLDSGGQERAILDAFRQIRDPRTRGYVVSLLQSFAER